MAGDSAVAQFSIASGSTPTTLICSATSPTAGKIYGEGALTGAFIVFNGGPGTTLGRVLARVATNDEYSVSGPYKYNRLYLYAALPWAPTPGVDTFYLSAGAPVAQGTLASATIDSGGESYLVGDVLALDGVVVGGSPHGTGGTMLVTATGSGGVITGAQIQSAGQQYYSAPGIGVTGGSGSGATFNLTVAPYLGFPYVPAPQQGIA